MGFWQKQWQPIRIPIRPATAWVWSGVLTVKASILLPISSNILRKSVYFLASLNLPATPSSFLRSTSQMATILPNRPASLESLEPLPLTPTLAMANCSLAALLSLGASPPATQKPIPVAAVVFRNRRRLDCLLMR